MVKEMLIKRNMDFPLNNLFDADKRRRSIIVELQNLKHQKNILAKEIAQAKKRNENVSNSISKMEQIGIQIKKTEDESKYNEEIYLK